MKIIEGWGTGLPRLFDRCKEMGLPEPKFEEFGDGIKVTIYRAIDDMKLGTDDTNESNQPNHGANESNNESNMANCEADDATNAIKGKLIEIIQKNPKISQRALSKELGVARSTVQRYMSQLEETGRLIRKGGTRGTWMIQEKI